MGRSAAAASMCAQLMALARSMASAGLLSQAAADLALRMASAFAAKLVKSVLRTDFRQSAGECSLLHAATGMEFPLHAALSPSGVPRRAC